MQSDSVRRSSTYQSETEKVLMDFGFRMAQTISMAQRTDSIIAYPGTHWEYALPHNPNQETANYTQLDERTDYTFEAITVGKETNWINTLPGKGWFTYFPWYCPTQAFFDKTWKLPDTEKLN